MLLRLLLVALASHQVVNVWRYSALFAGWRNWIEVGDFRLLGWRLPERAIYLLRSLHGCPWCLSIHVTLWLTVLYCVAPGGDVLVFVLAASQLANLIHHLTGHSGPKLN